MNPDIELTFQNCRAYINILTTNHIDNTMNLIGNINIIKQLHWVLVTLTFWTIKSLRTNTDVISINNNTSTVILAGGATTWCHCVKYDVENY